MDFIIEDIEEKQILYKIKRPKISAGKYVALIMYIGAIFLLGVAVRLENIILEWFYVISALLVLQQGHNIMFDERIKRIEEHIFKNGRE